MLPREQPAKGKLILRGAGHYASVTHADEFGALLLQHVKPLAIAP
jgi:hypothetical protein